MILDIEKTGIDGSMKGKFLSEKDPEEEKEDVFEYLELERLF